MTILNTDSVLVVFERLIFALLGVVIWEIFSTFDFEWSLISGRRKFRWPLVSSVYDPEGLLC